jgi:hypothetical protein
MHLVACGCHSTLRLLSAVVAGCNLVYVRLAGALAMVKAGVDARAGVHGNNVHGTENGPQQFGLRSWLGMCSMVQMHACGHAAVGAAHPGSAPWGGIRDE